MTRVNIYVPKIHDCITCINLPIAYHKNDLEVLTVATVCPFSKSDNQIERYHMIKFVWSTCIVWGEADQLRLIEINFAWLMIKIN